MRSTRSLAFVVLLIALLSTTLSSARAQSATSAPQEPADPALFDLQLAQAEIDAIQIEADRIGREIDQLLDQIEGLTIERDFIRLNDQARNETMQDARTRARNMAVNAYVGIGPPMNGIVVLDAQSANDLSYRHGLLRQQTQRLHAAAETYTALAGEADINVLRLADSINDELRRAEALNRALNQELDKLPHAEWVKSIAEIHAKADREFAKSQRVEPTAEEWRQLRFCESTETYDIDTGNTFYGAYQFTWETWGTVDGLGNPAHAPPQEQDARARLLYATRGSQPWPICGAFLP